MQTNSELIKPRRIYRDLVWPSFNERVLQDVQDKRNPLLEHLKLLGIY